MSGTERDPRLDEVELQITSTLQGAGPAARPRGRPARTAPAPAPARVRLLRAHCMCLLAMTFCQVTPGASSSPSAVRALADIDANFAMACEKAAALAPLIQEFEGHMKAMHAPLQVRVARAPPLCHLSRSSRLSPGRDGSHAQVWSGMFERFGRGYVASTARSAAAAASDRDGGAQSAASAAAGGEAPERPGHALDGGTVRGDNSPPLRRRFAKARADLPTPPRRCPRPLQSRARPCATRVPSTAARLGCAPPCGRPGHTSSAQAERTLRVARAR